MEQLSFIRKLAGPRETVGLAEGDIRRALEEDCRLGQAIAAAAEQWKTLKDDPEMRRGERVMISSVQNGICSFYQEVTTQPYIPLVAKGPWVVTLHGGVVHDAGGYGMLGFGHNPTKVLDAMREDRVMANVMTPSLDHNRFVKAMKKEIGHSRTSGCPYENFLMLNSGSEANSLASRFIDINTGNKIQDGQNVKAVSMVGCFHGRTFRPALWTDSTEESYQKQKTHLLTKVQMETKLTATINDIPSLEKVFAQAKENNWFIEAVYIEGVMGEGNPGEALTPEFYRRARELTIETGSMLLIDSIQAGLRCHGVLSVVDYPGFQDLEAPDFEVYSKALNAGQFPVSCLAMSPRAQDCFRIGVYGNTMTGNPRACAVAASVLGEITDELRENIRAMGVYAKQAYTNLQKDFPQCIEKVTGTGLLYAVHLNKAFAAVVAADGAEMWLRRNGINVIHGGENALRFTPTFTTTTWELDLQVSYVRKFFICLGRLSDLGDMGKRAEKLREVQLPHAGVPVSVRGHLFDKNVLSKMLDMVESASGYCNLSEVIVGASSTEPSSAVLRISTKDQEAFTKLTSAIIAFASENGAVAQLR